MTGRMNFKRHVDHPHACGDKALQLSKTNSHQGSSPRVWGQDYTGYLTCKQAGIIPTRVGTSTQCQFKLYARNGSSPRVWGQALKSVSLTFLGRIIPTRVGTSFQSRRLSPPQEDHPHACGDKSVILI